MFNQQFNILKIKLNIECWKNFFLYIRPRINTQNNKISFKVLREKVETLY